MIRWETACEKGNGNACWRLSQSVLAGQAVRKNTKRALALRDKACTLGSTEACGQSKHATDSTSGSGSWGLGKTLGDLGKIVGGAAITPLLLPLCALGVKNNPLCPLSWLK